MALAGAQHYNHSITIILQPGQHQLHSGSGTQLRNMSQLAIVGNGTQGEVVIRCAPLAGLVFLWSKEINISNVVLMSCGAAPNSTIKYANEYSLAFPQIQVALSFVSCHGIKLINVYVTDSIGTGVVIYNPVGVVNIEVSHNSLSGEQEDNYGEEGGGGGGLVVVVASQSYCTITNSTFTHNTASSEQVSFLYPTTNSNSYLGLGRGGGISVMFRGGVANITVQLIRVNLVNNAARYGGGLQLAFYDDTSSNNVTIVVTGNVAHC